MRFYFGRAIAAGHKDKLLQLRVRKILSPHFFLRSLFQVLSRMVATETDGLLSVPNGNGNDDNNTQRCSNTSSQTTSNWALVAVVSILVITLIVDISLRASASDTTETHASTHTSLHSTTPLRPHSEGRYYATQFISFTINTLGGLAEHGECEGKNVDPRSNSCYLGNTNIEKDVNHRLAIFGDVLHTLRNDVFQEDPEIDRDPRVLKIGKCLALSSRWK